MIQRHKVKHFLSKPSIKQKILNRNIALVVSIILGPLGIDRLYLGYYVTGILKLALTILGIFLLPLLIPAAAWWLADIYLVATKYKFSNIVWQ